jgi:hypothetical protein
LQNRKTALVKILATTKKSEQEVRSISQQRSVGGLDCATLAY